MDKAIKKFSNGFFYLFFFIFFFFVISISYDSSKVFLLFDSNIEKTYINFFPIYIFWDISLQSIFGFIFFFIYKFRKNITFYDIVAFIFYIIIFFIYTFFYNNIFLLIFNNFFILTYSILNYKIFHINKTIIILLFSFFVLFFLDNLYFIYLKNKANNLIYSCQKSNVHFEKCFHFFSLKFKSEGSHFLTKYNVLISESNIDYKKYIQSKIINYNNNSNCIIPNDYNKVEIYSKNYYKDNQNTIINFICYF